MIPTPIRMRTIWRDHPDRQSISLFVKPDNFCSNLFAALKRYDTNRAHVRLIKPFWSKVSLCVIEREVASCEFLVEHRLGFLSEASSRCKLQEFPVAEGPIVFVERFSVWHLY